MRIFLVTIGTLGDVLPFVALGEGLKKAGHDVTLCTASHFSMAGDGSWPPVRSHDERASGSPGSFRYERRPRSDGRRHRSAGRGAGNDQAPRPIPKKKLTTRRLAAAIAELTSNATHSAKRSLATPALAEIEAFLGKATVDDTVVFLVSGHGGYEYGQVSTYYFLSHEADTSKLPQTAIPYDELEGVLSGIRPRRKLLLLDTCQSGEFDPATLQAVRKAAERQGLSVRSRERLISEVINRPRTYLYQRDRYIYNNLSRRTGAVVFSSSLANESSLEKASLENGVFTHAVMRALTSNAADADRDGFIAVTELETAVKIAVASATGNLQHPEIQRDNIYQQIRLPLLR